MFFYKVDEGIELRLIEREHADDKLFKLVDANRQYWQRWHPRLRDALRSRADVGQYIAGWLQQFATNRGFCTGVWLKGASAA